MFIASEQNAIVRFLLLFCRRQTIVIQSRGRVWRQIYKHLGGRDYLVQAYRLPGGRVGRVKGVRYG